jgi:hypothetical protein
MFEKCILAEEAGKEENNQSAGVVGEDPESQIETGTPYMLAHKEVKEPLFVRQSAEIMEKPLKLFVISSIPMWER